MLTPSIQNENGEKVNFNRRYPMQKRETSLCFKELTYCIDTSMYSSDSNKCGVPSFADSKEILVLSLISRS